MELRHFRQEEEVHILGVFPTMDDLVLAAPTFAEVRMAFDDRKGRRIGEP